MSLYLSTLPIDLLPQLVLYLPSEDIKDLLLDIKQISDLKSLIKSKIFWTLLWKRDISTIIPCPSSAHKRYIEIIEKLSTLVNWDQIEYLAFKGYDVLLYPL